MRFRDRQAAGRLLAAKLQSYRSEEVIVYALPRGGVVLAAEIATSLHAPLDLIVTRKIGHPDSPEYAICAVSESGEVVRNEAEVDMVDPKWLAEAIGKEWREAKRRRDLYGRDRPRPNPKNKIAIVVDDGIATGLTMLAAIKEAKKLQPKKLVIAVAVTPRDIVTLLKAQADEVVALDVPKLYLGGVGAYYDHFDQVEDDEVMRLLENGPGNYR